MQEEIGSVAAEKAELSAPQIPPIATEPDQSTVQSNHKMDPQLTSIGVQVTPRPSPKEDKLPQKRIPTVTSTSALAAAKCAHWQVKLLHL